MANLFFLNLSRNELTGSVPAWFGNMSSLLALYAAAGRSAPRWTDASPVVGTTPIRAVHVMELRAALVALE